MTSTVYVGQAGTVQYVLSKMRKVYHGKSRGKQ